MRPDEIERYLNELLEVDRWAPADASLNGMQVAVGTDRVDKVAVAVDAALETIERAVEWGADLLLVHHGLFWGPAIAITGRHYARVRSLISADVGLYAAHLPLDAHPTLGNNAAMAAQLGLVDLRPFGVYKGSAIGWAGRLPEPMTGDAIARALFGTTEDLLGFLPFGPERIETVGIVSGGAPREVSDAIDQSLDMYITGDASHTIYHDCLEAGINVMFAGHYRTETWGVRAVAAHLHERFGVETTFLDVPTGL